MSRRELLKRAGAATAVGLVPLGIASCGDAARLHAASGQLQALTIEQAAALDAVTARLIPTDENGPGAREANVLRYIDRALATARREQQPAYAAWLAALDQYSRTRFGARFARLAPDKQDLLLVSVEEGAAAGFEASSSVFFATVLQHALEGMFGDPFWGGNANFVGWDLIGFNGIQLTWTAEMQQLDAAENIPPTLFPADQGMADLRGYMAQQIEGVLDDWTSERNRRRADRNWSSERGQRQSANRSRARGDSARGRTSPNCKRVHARRDPQRHPQLGRTAEGGGEVPTWRPTKSVAAGTPPTPALMTNAFGGTSIHYGTESKRYSAYVFRERSQSAPLGSWHLLHARQERDEQLIRDAKPSAISDSTATTRVT